MKNIYNMVGEQSETCSYSSLNFQSSIFAATFLVAVLLLKLCFLFDATKIMSQTFFPLLLTI